MNAPAPGTRCGCDACDQTFRHGLAWSSDGYCARCAERCYPAIEIDGRWSRATSSPEGRRAVHGMPFHAGGTPGGSDAAPLPQELFDMAIRSIPDPATRRQLRTAAEMADKVLPVLGPELGRAARWIAGAVRARRRPAP